MNKVAPMYQFDGDVSPQDPEHRQLHARTPTTEHSGHSHPSPHGSPRSSHIISNDTVTGKIDDESIRERLNKSLASSSEEELLGMLSRLVSKADSDQLRALLSSIIHKQEINTADVKTVGPLVNQWTSLANSEPPKKVSSVVLEVPRSPSLPRVSLGKAAHGQHEKAMTAHGSHGGAMDYSFEAYFEMTNFKVLKQRLPWLLGLLIFQSLSAFIMQAFEDVLHDHIVVAFFVPVIVGTGGNAGNQPGVMATRALSMEELSRKDLWRFIVKELKIAFMTASVLGVTMFVRVLAQFPHEPVSAIAIAVSVFCIIVCAVLLGIFLTVGLHRCKVDLASAGAPITTTTADICGILVLCVVSYLVLDVISLAILGEHAAVAAQGLSNGTAVHSL